MRTRISLATAALAAILILPLAFAQDEPAPKTYEVRIFDLRALASEHPDRPSPLFQEPESVFEKKVAANNAAPISPGDYASLLRDRLLPSEFADPSASVEDCAGYLIITQKPAVLARIPQLLAQVAASSQPQVSVQALEFFLGDEQALAWLGKAGQSVTDKEVETLLKPNSGAIFGSAPQLVCYSGQRSHINAGRTYTFVRDLDVAGDAFDPLPGYGIDGVVLDVRPTLDHRKSAVRTELRFLRSSRQSATVKKKMEAVVQPFVDEPEPKTDGQAVQPPKRTPIVSIGVLDLPAQANRTINTELNVPAESWIVAGMLEPVRGAKPGTNESRYLLLLLRCNRTTEPAGAQ